MVALSSKAQRTPQSCHLHDERKIFPFNWAIFQTTIKISTHFKIDDPNSVCQPDFFDHFILNKLCAHFKALFWLAVAIHQANNDLFLKIEPQRADVQLTCNNSVFSSFPHFGRKSRTNLFPLNMAPWNTIQLEWLPMHKC